MTDWPGLARRFGAVYQTNDSTCAQFGELSAVSLRARGAVGVVLEGGTRDVDFIVHEGFPARVNEVLAQAEAVVGTENAVREAVREEMAPLEAYERFGKF